MTLLTFLLLITGINLIFAQDINNHAFPDDFMFGAATAAYQVEGARTIDGKGENIFDRFFGEHPSVVMDGSNADIACDSYHKYKEDVQLLKSLGVHHYRFSIAWSRLLPNGFTNKINTAAVTYYKNLIKELKDNNIEPLVTMYHWDLPQPLQDAGGFESERLVDWFVAYAKLLFVLFGGDVKYWMTFNEPKQICHSGYGFENATFAPGVSSAGLGEYMCAHNILKAHAKVWHIYDVEFRETQQGKIGIVIDTQWYQPETNSTEDKDATETALQFAFGWYVHPLYNGDYPAVMKENIARRSKLQGFQKSRLPVFTEDEIDYLKGTVDLLGVNCYSANVVRHIENPDTTKSGWTEDQELVMYFSDDWPTTASNWIRVTPWALGDLIRWIKDQYGNPLMIVTENGYPDDGSTLVDDERISFYQQYLSHLRDTLDEGANLIGYTTWSLLDTFEWKFGYTTRYGLFHVDHTSDNTTRTPKKSVEYYKKIINTKCLVETCV